MLAFLISLAVSTTNITPTTNLFTFLHKVFSLRVVHLTKGGASEVYSISLAVVFGAAVA